MKTYIHEIFSHYDSDYPFFFNKTIIKEKQDYPLHWHEEAEFLFCLEGEICISIDTKNHKIKKGQLVFLKPEVLHDITINNAEYYFLIINKKLFKENNIDIDNIAVEQIIKSRETEDIFHKIQEERLLEKPFFRSHMQAYIILMISDILRKYSYASNTLQVDLKTKNKLSLVKSATKYIYDNYSKEITIDEISKEIGISKYYLCHIFKDLIGKSIIEYSNCIRCEKAKYLLLYSNLSMSQIYEMCGFSDPAYFSRTYKKIIGVSPSKTKSNHPQ